MHLRAGMREEETVPEMWNQHERMTGQMDSSLLPAGWTESHSAPRNREDVSVHSY